MFTFNVIFLKTKLFLKICVICLKKKKGKLIFLNKFPLLGMKTLIGISVNSPSF